MLASKESIDNGGVLADIVCMGTHTLRPIFNFKDEMIIEDNIYKQN